LTSFHLVEAGFRRFSGLEVFLPARPSWAHQKVRSDAFLPAKRDLDLAGEMRQPSTVPRPALMIVSSVYWVEQRPTGCPGIIMIENILIIG
jgi:hypothetical protein